MTYIRRSFLSILFLLAASAAWAAEPETYGEGVKLTASTSIQEIVSNPDAWNGKTVRVEGKVVGVCEMKGCWIELESQDQSRLRIKVEDDVIVFPAEAKGRWAVAEGTVSVREMTRDEWVRWQSHLAEEKGETFDEAAVGEGPYRLVQVQGTGAEIS